MRPHWVKRVEAELRFFLCREYHLEDIENKLCEMDDDIRMPSSSLSGMPRGSKVRMSIVEIDAETREDCRLMYEDKLQLINQRIRKMERALRSLTPLSRDVIRLSYFSLEFISDAEIAKSLEISLDELHERKSEALGKIYDRIYSTKRAAANTTIRLIRYRSASSVRHLWEFSTL